MRNSLKKLIALATLFSSSGIVYADPIDANVLQFIHSQTKSAFFKMCKEKLTNASDDACNCLADKTVANLDDNALKLCDSNDSSCMTKVVTAAGMKGFSTNNINQCQQNNSGSTSNASSTSTTSTDQQ